MEIWLWKLLYENRAFLTRKTRKNVAILPTFNHVYIKIFLTPQLHLMIFVCSNQPLCSCKEAFNGKLTAQMYSCYMTLYCSLSTSHNMLMKRVGERLRRNDKDRQNREWDKEMAVRLKLCETENRHTAPLKPWAPEVLTPSLPTHPHTQIYAQNFHTVLLHLTKALQPKVYILGAQNLHR